MIRTESVLLLKRRANYLKGLIIFFAATLLIGCNSTGMEINKDNIKSVLLESIKACNTELTFENEVLLSDFTEAYVAIYEYEPLAIGISKEVSLKKNEENKEFVEKVRFKYIFPIEEIDRQKDEMAFVEKQIIKEVNSVIDDQEKYTLIIDYLTQGFEYDDLLEDSNSVYSALCKKKANCQGIAKAFVLLCDEVGLKCGYCVGKLDGYPHMWNYVCVDNQKIQVDVLEKVTMINKDNRLLEAWVEYN